MLGPRYSRTCGRPGAIAAIGSEGQFQKGGGAGGARCWRRERPGDRKQAAQPS
jgi:hypothetical protein